MSDRRRDRRGRHVSVGGAAADETLESLVKQFSDRYAFIRELIQNSLDAGAARIDVVMTFDGRELRVEVRDDGEGMDRPIIEGYLLTLFRSTKEDDLTKIGKFGIGFTSIFAMEPFEVVVDTGRDGVWHRVTFDETRAYTLSRLADPYEGTTVTLRLARGRTAATEDVRRIRAAAQRWCRYADAAIATEARGTDEEWDPTPVAAPFSVEAPVVVTEESDGIVAVLGPHPSAMPPVGFYNRGITLWEAEDGALPGVTFRVAGRHLEHTLTRDNVIRDRHFEHVMARLGQVAATRLADAVHAEAEAAARSGDVARSARLFAAIHPKVPWAWREEAALVPGHGRALSLADLRGGRGWLDRIKGEGPTVWWAPANCPLGAAVAAGGTPVLVAAAGDEPYAAWAVRVLGGTRRRVDEGWFFARPAAVPAGAEALFGAAAGAVERAAAAGGAGSGASDRSRGTDPGVLAAELHGAALSGRLALALVEPWSLGRAPVPPPPRGAKLLVGARHPLVKALAALPPDLGGPLLVHAARAAAGLPTDRAALADAIAAKLGASAKAEDTEAVAPPAPGAAASTAASGGAP